MLEYEYLFSTTLQRKLKPRIIGNIFVKVTRNNELLVVISKDGEELFKHFYENFSEKILNGYTTDYAVYEIVRDYRKCILENFFY